MAKPTKKTSTSEQSERFKQAARDFGCDEDEARFDEQLKKVARQKPKDEPPAPKSPEAKKLGG